MRPLGNISIFWLKAFVSRRDHRLSQTMATQKSGSLTFREPPLTSAFQNGSIIRSSSEAGAHSHLNLAWVVALSLGGTPIRSTLEAEAGIGEIEVAYEVGYCSIQVQDIRSAWSRWIYKLSKLSERAPILCVPGDGRSAMMHGADRHHQRRYQKCTCVPDVLISLTEEFLSSQALCCTWETMQD
jgi:hypothetical protein